MADEAPQGRWWHSPMIAERLNLSENEVQRLENVFDDSRIRMIEYKNKVEAEQVRLQALLEKRNLDEKAIRIQNRKLEEARTALANERTAFVLEVRKIIGHQRFQQLIDMQARAKKRAK